MRHNVVTITDRLQGRVCALGRAGCEHHHFEARADLKGVDEQWGVQKGVLKIGEECTVGQRGPMQPEKP